MPAERIPTQIIIPIAGKREINLRVHACTSHVDHQVFLVPISTDVTFLPKYIEPFSWFKLSFSSIFYDVRTYFIFTTVSRKKKSNNLDENLFRHSKYLLGLTLGMWGILYNR